MITSADWLREWHRPDSFVQKLMNSVFRDILLESRLVKAIFLQWSRLAISLEAELAELIEESKARNAVRYPDIVAPPLLSMEAFLPVSDDPWGLKEMLHGILQTLEHYISALQEARADVSLAYQEAHARVMAEMIVRADEMPLLRRDGSRVSVSNVLERVPSVSRIVNIVMDSAMAATPPEPLTEHSPMLLTPLSLVPRPSAGQRRKTEEEKGITNLFVKKTGVLTELNLLFAARQNGESVMAAHKRTEKALDHIMKPLRTDAAHAAHLADLVSLEIGCSLSQENIRRLESGMDAIPLNRLRIG